MAENKILPWAQTSTANALSDADYAADVATGGSYADGVKSGQASSKQANKTWRQATAPGSGLGQFIVDNLSVDVTDADTPATFSTRIANAVLKLAQVSPFNQAWATATGGYRKYAIVSDSSGNFWVSTADKNTTTPGASGAKWQDLFNGYATQAWANGRFQPAGDYATNPALQSVNTNLQNQINNRVLKTGDTISWLNCNGEITVRGSNPNTNNGDWNYAPGFSTGFDGRTSFDIFSQEHVGDTTDAVFSLMWNGSPIQYWWFNQAGGITSSSKGAVAFESDISNLQNQINGKQPAGNYVSASQYSDDFSTSDSRVINLAYGHKLQGFVVAVNGSGVHDIAFPQSFSGVPTTIVISNGLTDGRNDSVSVLSGWTTTGFQIQTNGSTSVNFLAVGPK